MWGLRAGVEGSDIGQDRVEFRKTLHLFLSQPLLLCSSEDSGGTQLQILGGGVLPDPLLHHPSVSSYVHMCV